ncbi:MAG: GGDEF domain-containing protein, partial [Acidobacteria bacterium]|nr:GGDEF domain-containing protein [Acidobacteriota bacterium]
VGVVDIDHFKQMNDLHGHEAGDRCLQALADLLRHSRASDLVARWGGEELVVIMPGSTATGAAAGLQRLLDQARSTIVIEDTPLSFSAGVAMVESDLLGVLDGIRAADAAMYEAKRRGRGQVVVSAADAR